MKVILSVRIILADRNRLNLNLKVAFYLCQLDKCLHHGKYFRKLYFNKPWKYFLVLWQLTYCLYQRRKWNGTYLSSPNRVISSRYFLPILTDSSLIFPVMFPWLDVGGDGGLYCILYKLLGCFDFFFGSEKKFTSFLHVIKSFKRIKEKKE